MVTRKQFKHQVLFCQIKALVFIIAAILFTLTLSSCATNFAHHMALRNAKAISSVYSGYEVPAPNDGRLIIYWEKKPMIPASGKFEISGDAGYLEAGFITQTGIVIDLPEGSYSFSLGGILNKQDVQLEIESGETYCFNTSTLFVPVIIGSMSGELIPMPPQECLSELAEKDIRCSLYNCFVQTIIPDKSGSFQSYSSKYGHEQAETASKEIVLNPEKSRVYITRDMYTLGMVKAGLDAPPAFTMKGDSYVCYEVDPGYHTITVSDPNGERGFKLKTKRNKIYYFHTDTLNYLDPSRGRELVEDYQLLKNGFLVE